MNITFARIAVIPLLIPSFKHIFIIVIVFSLMNAEGSLKRCQQLSNVFGIRLSIIPCGEIAFAQ